MGRTSPNASISGSSRRRLARWLVGSPMRVVERDLVLETLAYTRGNRTLSAQLLGVSVRTLRNKITEYSAQGVYVTLHESRAQHFDATQSRRVYDEAEPMNKPKQTLSDVHPIVRSRCQSATRDHNQMHRVEL